MIDKDGFLIASEKDDIINNKHYTENLFNLCITIGTLTKHSNLDVRNNTELISIKFAQSLLKLLIREINDNVFFISLIPEILNPALFKIEFERIIEGISRYY